MVDQLHRGPRESGGLDVEFGELPHKAILIVCLPSCPAGFPYQQQNRNTTPSKSCLSRCTFSSEQQSDWTANTKDSCCLRRHRCHLA